MTKPITVREAIMLGICLILAHFAFFKKWDNVKLNEDKVRSEKIIKAYQENSKMQHHISDSLKTKVKIAEEIIEYQKKNPKIIIEKYDKLRDNVNMLGTDESIRFLSGRLSQESGH